jgi:hypothetical protein
VVLVDGPIHAVDVDLARLIVTNRVSDLLDELAQARLVVRGDAVTRASRFALG